MARPKGSTNLQNKAIKDMIREALQRNGNADYFAQQAVDNPTAFMTLVGKLIPAEINVDTKIDGTIKVEIVRFGADNQTSSK